MRPAYSDPTSENVQDTLIKRAVEAEYAPDDPRGYIIDGIATQGQGRPDGGRFRCPLITEAFNGVWQGGCMWGFKLPDEIDHVVSLYPWEKYILADHQTRTEYRMYDGPVDQNEGINEAADEIARTMLHGKTVLVHCQAGLNRSALTLGLAMIRTLPDTTPQQIINRLREKRSPMVLCNKSFEQFLLEQGA